MINTKIVAHSKCPKGHELISALCTFPRIILAEVNTHRMLSKNTSSSRAIPFNKMVEAVINNPFIPIAWQKYHPGMQGNEYIDGDHRCTLIQFITSLKLTLNTIKDKESKEYRDLQKRIEEKVGLITTLLKEYSLMEMSLKDWWLFARDKAVECATILYVLDVTKQLANRLLEPFMWTTMLITGPRYGGGWDNFFNLRCPQYSLFEDTPKYNSVKEYKNAHANDSQYNTYDVLNWLKINRGQAEIHMMALAESIYDAIQESVPTELKEGEWHIPFIDNIHEFYNDNIIIKSRRVGKTLDMVKISTAMAARTSYTIVGDEKQVDYLKMIELHDRLIAQNPPHSSPMEHCAQVMTSEEYHEFFKGVLPTMELGEDNHLVECYLDDNDYTGWCRNYRGFIPYRHIIEQSR